MIQHVNHIGERIRDLRTSRGWTQKELAQQAGIDVRSLQRIEKSQVNPRAYTLNVLSEILDAELLGGEPISHGTDMQNILWIAFIHLSGLFILVLPPVIIWLLKKEQIEGLNMHFKVVMNFQLSILIYVVASILLIPLGVGLLLLILLSLYSTIVIVFNTIRVSSEYAIKYPLSIPIINLTYSRQQNAPPDK